MVINRKVNEKLGKDLCKMQIRLKTELGTRLVLPNRNEVILDTEWYDLFIWVSHVLAMLESSESLASPDTWRFHVGSLWLESDWLTLDGSRRPLIDWIQSVCVCVCNDGRSRAAITREHLRRGWHPKESRCRDALRQGYRKHPQRCRHPAEHLDHRSGISGGGFVWLFSLFSFFFLSKDNCFNMKVLPSFEFPYRSRP